MNKQVTSSKDVSVIICSYSEARWTDLIEAVASVRSQTCLPGEIIVVIDHNPAMLERVRADIDGVVAIENGQQKGLSGARNSGVTAASGSIVAFLDDDATASPTWLSFLCDCYCREDVLGAGGSILPVWQTGRPSWFPEELDWVVGCTFRGMPEKRSRVGKLIGCNMSFRREVFDVVGGFRSEMGRVGLRPLAGEETEFSHAVCGAWPEGKLVYEPMARVHHKVPAARANWAYLWSRSYCEGLSKALITSYVGTGDGLAAERAYVTRILPIAILRGLRDALTGRSQAGFARSWAIASSLFVTLWGYGVGILAAPRSKKSGGQRRPLLAQPQRSGEIRAIAAYEGQSAL